MSTMSALVVRAPMDFGIEEVPVPDCPAGGLLLKVLACGLCGSDLRTLRRGHHRVTLPWIIGHEICGEILEAGSEVQGSWQVGDLLSVAPPVYCGQCDFCNTQRPELCDSYREIAQVWPGGFAEYMAIPSEALAFGAIHPVPQGLDIALAGIAEPISSCIHAQEVGRVADGDRVVVMGAGPVGCIHMALARSFGAKCVIAVDVNPHRLEQAHVFQPDAVIDAGGVDFKDQVLAATDGQGADVVVTANPSPQAQIQAVEIARKGGRILLFGGLPPEECRPGIDMNKVHYQALHIIGTTIFAPRHHRQALELLVTGRLDGEKLITHRASLTDFPTVAQEALDGKVRKAVFYPHEKDS